MEDRDWFGELRSQLHQPPGTVRFVRICRVLGRMWAKNPGRVDQEILPYALEVMADWPDEHRVYPRFWNELWLAPAAPEPFSPLELIARMELDHEPLTLEQFERLARAPLHQLRWLDLTDTQLGEAGARALAGADRPRLEELRVADNPLGDRGLALLLGSAGAPRLRQVFAWSSRINRRSGCAARGARGVRAPRAAVLAGQRAEHGRAPGARAAAPAPGCLAAAPAAVTSSEGP